jgi:hypothetical protein
MGSLRNLADPCILLPSSVFGKDARPSLRDFQEQEGDGEKEVQAKISEKLPILPLQGAAIHGTLLCSLPRLP